MKLFIINGEKNDEKVEIHVNEDSKMRDIKYKLDEILHGNGNFTKYYFRFIYKNIILWENMSMKHNKICENDEIWFGKIESYLSKDDDVIVYVIICGGIYDGGEYLIVKMNDRISIIRSIIERIYPKIINIWNTDGKQMRNNQIVTKIDTNKNYKLIIRLDDGEGNKINKTFNECCYLHDRYYVDQYLLDDQTRDDNKNESTRTILINYIDQIKQNISSNDTIYDKLKQDLSDLPSSFINSTNLFCYDISVRILYICNDLWRFVENQYENDALWIFCNYLKYAIHAALRDFSNNRQQDNNKTNKSMRNILIDSLDYFVRYLKDSSNDWRYWLRLWTDRYLLRSFSDSDLNERIDECPINKLTIKLRMKGKDRNNFFDIKPETIIEAKQIISHNLFVDMKHLYCIKPGGDHKLKDEDKFDEEFIFEIVLRMDDIEILRLLGKGAYGKIYLCRYKTSNKQFVLKKPIDNDRDLYRDINIYSKLNSTRYIMIYSGLFRHKERICIGMEYMSGGSLRSYLDKEKQLSEQETVRISYEILTQIIELHKLGIIHRDINPDNIALDEHNHAKLIDFGLSKYTIGLTSKDLLDKLKAYAPGTIRYMAPELMKGEQYSDKIDIWSFGMVMVEMVTGKRPFHWINAEVMISIHIHHCTKYEFEPIVPISNEFNQFINSCLNMNPDERPNGEQLIKSELLIDY